jgi:hypothetical protein
MENAKYFRAQPNEHEFLVSDFFCCGGVNLRKLMRRVNYRRMVQLRKFGVKDYVWHWE